MSNEDCIFGLQEVSAVQYDSLIRHLPEHIKLIKTPFSNVSSVVIGYNTHLFDVKEVKSSPFSASDGNAIQSCRFVHLVTKYEYVFVNMHCPWKQGSVLKDYLLNTSDQLTIFVGDSNYASKPQIDYDQPVLVECFGNSKYGFIVPRKDRKVTWTNLNIRKNVMTSEDINWLYDHTDTTLEDLQKRKLLEQKQYDAFDVIGVQFNWPYPRFTFGYENVDCLHGQFKC